MTRALGNTLNIIVNITDDWKTFLGHNEHDHIGSSPNAAFLFASSKMPLQHQHADVITFNTQLENFHKIDSEVAKYLHNVNFINDIGSESTFKIVSTM